MFSCNIILKILPYNILYNNLIMRYRIYRCLNRVDQNHGAELSYVLPTENVTKFEMLFSDLEMNKEELKISSYGASQTTMDEVFIRLVFDIGIL